jgi:hypothetical protein
MEDAETTREELEDQAETSGYGATEGETEEAPSQVLPDPPVQPDRPDEPPRVDPPELPDPQGPWNEPAPPELPRPDR